MLTIREYALLRDAVVADVDLDTVAACDLLDIVAEACEVLDLPCDVGTINDTTTSLLEEGAPC
jgi:hypothetical protein